MAAEKGMYVYVCVWVWRARQDRSSHDIPPTRQTRKNTNVV